MNKYERLGRIVTWMFIAFCGAFSFSAVIMSLLNLLVNLTAIETLQVCVMTGILFCWVGLAHAFED